MTRPAEDYVARLSASAVTAADHQPATCVLCQLHRAEDEMGIETPAGYGRYLVSPSADVVAIIDHDEPIDVIADGWTLVRAASESHARVVARQQRKAMREGTWPTW